MKTRRLKNAFALICNLLIVAFTFSAIAYNFRSDIIRDEGWFGYRGWKSLRFFTNLSNVYAALTSLVAIFFIVGNIAEDSLNYPRIFRYIKFSSTVAVGLTFGTVVFFLGPYAVALGASYFSLFTNNNVFLHFLTPLLAMATYSLFENGEKQDKRSLFIGMLPTVAYSLVYLVMVAFVGEENGGWPDFYGFTFGGRNGFIPLAFIGMYSASLLIGFILITLANKTISGKTANVKPTTVKDRENKNN